MLLEVLEEFQDRPLKYTQVQHKVRVSGLQAAEAGNLHALQFTCAEPPWLFAPRYKQWVFSCPTALVVCSCTSTPLDNVGKVLPHFMGMEELVL